MPSPQKKSPSIKMIAPTSIRMFITAQLAPANIANTILPFDMSFLSSYPLYYSIYKQLLSHPIIPCI